MLFFPHTQLFQIKLKTLYTKQLLRLFRMPNPDLHTIILKSGLKETPGINV